MTGGDTPRAAVLDPPPPAPAPDAPLRAAPTLGRTVAAAAAHAATLGAALPGRDAALRPPHAAAPALGTRAALRWVVVEEDTAAAVGHPDPTVDVLSSPTLGLWFELAASSLMPAPGGALRHVGVGLVVHHVGSARVGETIDVHVVVAGADGRAVWFDVAAWADATLVATGVHHRLVLDA